MEDKKYYSFGISKRESENPSYIKFINRQILGVIEKHIDEILNITSSNDIYETDNTNICLNMKTRKNVCRYNLHDDEFIVEISSVKIRELETYFVSRMEELRFNNPQEKATFKERLQILFKGFVDGGKFHTREVNKDGNMGL